jgi:hypothetical protein
MLVASITARAAASGCKRSPDWASAKSGTNGAIGKAAVLRRDVRKRPCAPKAWQPLLSSFSTTLYNDDIDSGIRWCDAVIERLDKALRGRVADDPGPLKTPASGATGVAAREEHHTVLILFLMTGLTSHAMT